MAILIDETKRVLVQGITGREGQARTRLMREYGTNVVAGVTPGKGGQTVLGVPVFNTPQDAVKALGEIDISVLFVPAAGVKEAAISAIDAGIKLTVLVPDRVPVWDAMEIAAAAKANGAMFHRTEHAWSVESGQRRGRHDRRSRGKRAAMVQARHSDRRRSDQSLRRHGFEHGLLSWDRRACAFPPSRTSAATRFLEFGFPMRR